MRITNMMTSQKMYNDITKNRMRVDKYYTQMSTGKSIMYPSDDPIRASRALKFRTNVSQAEQYQRNVAQGYSWMEISELAIANVEELTLRIRTLAEQGANDSYDPDDRDAIATEIKSLIEEIGMQMNQTYGGRNVFTGYRTDVPAVFTTASSNSYEIKQDFSYMNIESFRAYSKTALDDVAKLVDGYKLQLPYNHVENIDFKQTVNFQTTSDTTSTPNANTVVYDAGTKGFTISSDYTFTGSITIDGKQYALEAYTPNNEPYDQTKVFYDGNTYYLPNALTEKYKDETVPLPISVSVNEYLSQQTPSVSSISINELSRNNEDAYTPGAWEVNYIHDTGELILSQEVKDYLTSLGRTGFSVEYTKKGFEKGELNPLTYFDCIDKTQDSLNYGKVYDMKNQSLEYEFSTNIRIGVNNLAKDIFTVDMYSDLKEFCSFLNNTRISSKVDLELHYSSSPYNLQGDQLTKKVDEHISEESKKSRDALQKRFETLLGNIDGYSSTISKQRADMGTRMSRLELLKNRLGDDALSYTKLLSENEDADLMEATMNWKTCDAIYQASLSVSAKLLQTSLIDFLR